MKIEIDQSNVITSKDQVKIGMHMWNVGQGGVSRVSSPVYIGQVIGFGVCEYAFHPNDNIALGFSIIDSHSGEEFVVLGNVSSIGTNTYTPIDLNIPENGFERNVIYPRDILIEGLSPEVLGGVTRPMVKYISYLPTPHNNWYVCDSLEKANAVYEEMLNKWNDNHEKERLEYNQLLDSLDF